MKKYQKPLFFALVLPFLMGNSPVPAPQSSNYEDFAFSDVACVSHDEDYSIYSSTITNNGTGYIRSTDIVLVIDDYYTSYPIDVIDKEVLAPGKSYEYFFRNNTYFEDLTNAEIFVQAYIDEIPDVISITGITDKVKSSYSSYDINNNPTTTFTYSFYFQYEILNEEIDFGAVYEFEYGGESHYFFSSNFYEYYSIESMIDINVNTDLKFKSVHAFEIEKYNYVGGLDNFVFGSLLVFFLVVEFVSACFPTIIGVLLGLLVIGGITVALIFIIRGIVRAKKRKNQSKQNDEQNKENDGKNDL